MGLFAELLGRGRAQKADGQRSVSEIEQALARLRRGRAEADASFKAAHARRAELLLSDATLEEVKEIEALAEAASLTLERLELVEPKLLEELTASRNAAEREAWRDLLRDAYAPAAADHAAKYRAALEAWEKLGSIRAKAIQMGLGDEAATAMRPVPVILNRDSLVRIERENDRVQDLALALSCQHPHGKAALFGALTSAAAPGREAHPCV
jgi:hypothetical protein